jgi:hypothetical protein
VDLVRFSRFIPNDTEGLVVNLDFENVVAFRKEAVAEGKDAGIYNPQRCVK